MTIRVDLLFAGLLDPRGAAMASAVGSSLGISVGATMGSCCPRPYTLFCSWGHLHRLQCPPQLLWAWHQNPCPLLGVWRHLNARHSWKFVILVCDKRIVIFIRTRLKVLCEITNILAMPIGESQNRWFIYTKYVDTFNYSGRCWEDHPLMSNYSLATVQCKEQLTP